MVSAVPGYRILGEVASGASGTVFRAEQLELGRVVALKILSPGLFDEQTTRARFLREARLQARLGHPRILRVYDAGIVDGRPFLAMELVEGGSLRELLLREGALSVARALRLAAGIAEGLAAAHRIGVAHRDLKPENVLLVDSEEVKLADFGLAKAYSESQTLQTAAGVILGTPGYISPEVLSGAPAGSGADVYALGAILYEMLAGRPPFKASSVAGILRAQAAGRVEPLSSHGLIIPDWLERLTLECLSVAPASRPAAESLAARLAGTDTPGANTMVLRLKPAAASGPSGTIRLTPASRRLPLVAIAAIAGTLLVAAVIRSLPAVSVPPEATAGSPVVAADSKEVSNPPLKSLPRHWVAVGTDHARFHFDKALPPGATVTLGTRAGQRTVALTGDGPRYDVGGLLPGQLHLGQIESSGRSSPVSLTTLARSPRSGAAILGVDGIGVGAEIVLAAHGEEVAVAWTAAGPGPGRSSEIRLRESPDMGATWYAPRKLGERDWRAHSLALCRTKSSTWFGWVRTTARGAPEQLSLVELGGRPAAPIATHSVALEPAPVTTDGFRAVALAGGPEDGVHVAACVGAGQSGTHRLATTLLAPGSPSFPPWSPMVTTGHHRELKLLSLPAGLHLLAATSKPEVSSQLGWSWTSGENRRDWKPAREVTNPFESPAGFSVVPYRGGLLLAYASAGAVWTRRLDSDPEVVAEAVPVSSRPAARRLSFARETHPELASGDRYLYILYFGLTTTYDWKLVVLGGESLAKLSPVAVKDLDGPTPKALAVAAGPHHLLVAWADDRGFVRALRLPR
ncbi:MAG: serine/threonine protein kinase [Candidatus Wallbacteria bacterium]|nr:serine/threonine protein kinase [Candidatus Wallbacteria bacterium]